jgi:hypothetical integral membrane protein (TIGR02206 family)
MFLAHEPVGRLAPYGAEHIAVLVATVVITALALAAVRRARDVRAVERWLARAGWALLAVTLAWTAWWMLPAHWHIDESLPLHFTDVLRVVTAVALIAKSGWAIAVSYFWGLTLNLQAFVSPDLGYYAAPGLEFTMFWVLHIAALVAPIVLVWGLGYRPTWAGYGTVLALTAGWASVAIAGNAVTGANYGYLSRDPGVPSMLDLLGPWPVSILWELVLVLAVWAAMTLPWTTGRRTASAPVADRLGLVRRHGALVTEPVRIV